MQDYIVLHRDLDARLWDFIHAHENDPVPSAKPAQNFDESKHPRDERGRFTDRDNTRPKSKLESTLLFGKVTSKSRLNGYPETTSLGSRAGLHRLHKYHDAPARYWPADIAVAGPFCFRPEPLNQ